MNSGVNGLKVQRIGRGSHWDKIAARALKRKDSIRNTDVFVTECGLGASGFPHIGSFADASRAYAIKVAIDDRKKYEAVFYAYSDDLDGLRKVPTGLSSDLVEWLGVPVTLIPDPEGCHDSYGEHMTSLLLASLDEAGIEYVHKSAAKLYREGAFTGQISTLLANAERAGQIIQEVTSQEKYTELIPFHPICKQCKKIYTTIVRAVDIEKHRVSYSCEGAEIRGKDIPGCGYQGVADYSKGEGKLSWKVEFASRWDALQVDFEPYGKDILESVKVNDNICREILDYEPPFHIRYEMFLDKGGKKISKSKGNVFTPQMWLKYGSPQSLILLTLKRIEGTRSLSIDDIPKYMDEMDELEAIYFDLKKEKDSKQLMIKKALYEYCWWLKIPEKPSVKGKIVPYRLISLLARYVPAGIPEEDFIRDKLLENGTISSLEDWNLAVAKKHKYVSNWVKDRMDEEQDAGIELMETELKALEQLVKELGKTTTAEEIKQAIFSVAKSRDIKPDKFFSVLYQIFIGTTSGPQLAPLIEQIGVEEARKTIETVLFK